MNEVPTGDNWLDAKIEALKGQVAPVAWPPAGLEYITVGLYGWRGELANKLSWLSFSDSLICRLGLAVRVPKPGQMPVAIDNFGIKSSDVRARIEELRVRNESIIQLPEQRGIPVGDAQTWIEES